MAPRIGMVLVPGATQEGTETWQPMEVGCSSTTQNGNRMLKYSAPCSGILKETYGISPNCAH